MDLPQAPDLPWFKTENRKGFVIVRIDRPPVNAFSRETFEQLDELLAFIEETPAIKAMVLACKDDARAWIGGGDLNEFLSFTPASRRDRHLYAERVTNRLYNLPCPVIAAVLMPAPGGGMVIASFCDMIVASQDAFFSMPEVDRGLTGGAGAYFNRLNLPVPFIREIVLTGRKVSAQELKAYGFVNYVLPKNEVLPKAVELAELVAQKSAVTVRAIKKSANRIDAIGWAQGRDKAHEMSEALVAGADYQEAIKAFLERRKPIFD